MCRLRGHAVDDRGPGLMPRGLDATWLAQAAAETSRPFHTVTAHFDSGTRRLWDGDVDRTMLGGQLYEGGALSGIGQITMRSESGAARVEVVASGLDPTHLADALVEQFYGRRGTIGRGYIASDGTILIHEILIDGLIVLVRVTHEPDNSITWKMAIEVGTARGRQAVGARRTFNGQRDYSTYLWNGTGAVDEGMQFVTALRKPVVWPANGYLPPDLRTKK
jgi:hypothetical protein